MKQTQLFSKLKKSLYFTNKTMRKSHNYYSIIIGCLVIGCIIYLYTHTEGFHVKYRLHKRQPHPHPHTQLHAHPQPHPRQPHPHRHTRESEVVDLS